MNRSIRHKLRIALLLVFLCTLLTLAAWPPGAFCSQSSAFNVPVYNPDSRDMAEDFSVRDSFQSHLPVLVFTFSADNSGSSALSAQLSLHGTFSGEKVPLSDTGVSYPVLLKEESAPDASGKKSYSIELSGTAGAVLAGLPPDTRWRLQGSARDKGMLRNGIAYTLGQVMIPELTPQTTFCEVLFNKNGKYYYQGIYILAQDLEHLLTSDGESGDRKAFFKYSPAEDKKRTPDPQAESAIWGLSIRERGFSPLFADQAPQEMLLEYTLGHLESAFGSIKPEEFLAYTSQLNSDSVYTLYILNSLMLNTPAPGVPFSFFQDTDGKLNAMPIWNFDTALDNAPKRLRPLPFDDKVVLADPPALLDRMVPVWRSLEGGASFEDLDIYHLYRALGGQDFLWFEHLFLSKPFLDGLYAYYHKLRRGPLSPENVDALLAAQIEDLGPALERDWYRWKTAYAASAGPFFLSPATDDKGKTYLRQTGTLGDELVKIRHCLRQQNVYLFENIGRIEWMTVDLFDNSTTGNRQAAYAITMVITFLALSHIVTRQL